MKYYIKTFGCQMNYSDSERIAGFLEKHGFKKASDITEADLAVFNTCGVRQMAEDRVYGQVHNLHEAWSMEHGAKGSKRKIILTGCLAHRKDVQRRLKDKVDLFVDIKDFNKEIKGYLSCHPESPRRRIPNEKTKVFIDNTEILHSAQNDNYFCTKPKYNSKHTAFVPIMTGCNNFCSYCVVPYARGREVSRPADEIIKEVKDLTRKGYKEIILLGQNVNSYQSFDKNSSSGEEDKLVNFSTLLKKINSIPGNFWISFLSNHPKDFSDELIETATKLKKVCECVHLPIQSGDDKILAKMNRRYTSVKYLERIRKIKRAFEKNKPGKLYAITSDIIVGFPGETKKQFLQSAKIMEKVGYDMVYLGQFSPRPETAAWKMKDNVSKKEKSRREKYLNEILKKTSFENNQSYVGKIVEVLIQKEKIPKAKLFPIQSLALEKNEYFGKTRTGKNVKMTTRSCHPELSAKGGSASGGDSGSRNLIGKIIRTKIIKANIWNLEACLPKRQGKIK